MNLCRAPSSDQREADDHDDQPDDPDQEAAAGVMHGAGGEVLRLAGLVGTLARDDLEGQDRKEGVDQPAHQGLQARARAVALAGNTERGLAEPPQRVAHEADGQQPQRDEAERLGRQQLQGALLVGLVLTLADRDQDGDYADQDVDHAAGGQAGPGQYGLRGCPRPGGPSWTRALKMTTSLSPLSETGRTAHHVPRDPPFMHGFARGAPAGEAGAAAAAAGSAARRSGACEN